MKLLNAFSLSMVQMPSSLEFKPVTSSDAFNLMRQRGFESCIGHQTTADMLTEMSGIQVQMNRCNTRLQKGEQALIAQYIGPRLPEGVTSLPEGAEIQFVLATVI